MRGAMVAAERHGAEYRRVRRALPGILALARAELEALQMAELRRLVSRSWTRASHGPGCPRT